MRPGKREGRTDRLMAAAAAAVLGLAACTDVTQGAADAGALDKDVIFLHGDAGRDATTDVRADTATTADTTGDTAAALDAVVDTHADVATTPDTVADTAADTVADTAPTPDAAGDTGMDTVTDAVTDAVAVPDAVPDVVPIPDTAVDTAVDAAPDVSSDVAPDPALVGCADGTREGFLHVNQYPLLAACTGAWDIPGIHHPEGPACGREAGNDGLNTLGQGCNVEDLCAAGWHVCLGKTDVLMRNETGCDGIMTGAVSPAFFLARTSSTGAFNCAPDAIGEPVSENDLFGCGDLGCKATVDTCAPLTQASHDLCKTLKNMPGCSCTWNADGTDVKCSPSSGGCGWCKPLDYWNLYTGVTHPDAWDCGTDTSNEAVNVIKSQPDQQGGVLCCQDMQ